MPSRRRRRPHNRPLTSNKMGLPPEAHKRYREEQEKQRQSLQQVVRTPVGVNICLECDGTGKAPGSHGHKNCPVCHGRGTTQVWPPKVRDALKARVAAQEGQRQTMNALVQALASDPVKMMASMPTFMSPGQLPDPAASTQIIPAKSRHTVTGRFASQPAIQSLPATQLPTTHLAARRSLPIRSTAQARPGVRLVHWEDMIQDKKPTEIKPDGTERFLIMPHEYANCDILLPNDQLVFKGDSKMLILEVSPKGRWPAVAVAKEAREAPKREGTWWELPEEEEEKPQPEEPKPAVSISGPKFDLHQKALQGGWPAGKLAIHPGVLLNPTTVQPMTVGPVLMILDEIEIEVDPFDLQKPMVGDYLDAEDTQTGHRIRTQITNIVSTSGSNGEEILHLRVNPSLTGFDANHLRVEQAGARYRPLHLSPAFKIEKAKEQVERAFREHLNQYLGRPTSAVTLQDVKALAEQVIARFKAEGAIIPDHQVEVVQDPLEPGRINVTVHWRPDPRLINVLAKELDENLPAGVEANLLVLEEPEEEEEPKVKQPIGREQSFWKLPKS